MLLMESKRAFQFKKGFKNAKFGQCGPHLLRADWMRRSDCNLSLTFIQDGGTILQGAGVIVISMQDGGRC